MKKLVLLFLLLLPTLTYAQNEHPNLYKNITGVQLGIMGLELYNEAKLNDKWAMRGSLLLSPMYSGGGNSSTKFYVEVVPTLLLQTKYYYSLSKRIRKQKNIAYNSANYVGFEVLYDTGQTILSSDAKSKTRNRTDYIGLMSTWGIRRNFGKKFNWEFTTSFGYATGINQQKMYSFLFNQLGAESEQNKTPNLRGLIGLINIKIGFDFHKK